MTTQILVGDCRTHMQAMEPESVHAIVTDPPYGLEFMGKEWDKLTRNLMRSESVADNERLERYGTKQIKGISKCPDLGAATKYGRKMQEWHHSWAVEAFMVLKPGGHLLAFGGTRTFHRLTCAIEDAGFEIRDCLSWMYGSGFPKSHNLGREWGGWGTALKPAWEPIILARKPLIGTVAANVTAHGTGAINIDACRIGFIDQNDANRSARPGHSERQGKQSIFMGDKQIMHGEQNELGRWPANVCLDEAAAVFLDEQSGELSVVGGPKVTTHDAGMFGIGQPGRVYRDTGGASRFFYTAKASRSERNKGLDGMPEQQGFDKNTSKRIAHRNPETGEVTYSEYRASSYQNHHPTVKPVDLMQWLVKLVCPPGGIVLDPFMGSGTTGIAADRLGFDFIGIEISPEYAEIARKRIVGDCPLFADIA